MGRAEINSQVFDDMCEDFFIFDVSNGWGLFIPIFPLMGNGDR